MTNETYRIKARNQMNDVLHYGIKATTDSAKRQEIKDAWNKLRKILDDL